MRYVPHFFLLGVCFHISFQLLLETRLLPNLGGDGTRLGITAYNDTGSTALTIFDIDLEYLGNRGNYGGWCEDVMVVVADGGMERLHSLWVQVRFVVPETFLPWGPWILEQAVIRKAGNGVIRLAGSGMRKQLFFGTSPGNTHVAVATTKGGMQSII